METAVAEALRTRAFREFTHVVWGYGALIERALAANDDPRPLLAVLTRATERVARSTHAERPDSPGYASAEPP